MRGLKGSFYQSRKQSDYYNRLKEGERKDFAINWVATLNYQLLKPFIKITNETKYGREIFYEINIDRLNKKEKAMLNKIYSELKEKQLSFGDGAETYTTGYRNGHTNGQIELLERILNIDTGLCSEDK